MSLSKLSGINPSTIFGILSGYGRVAGLTEEDRKLALDRFRLRQPHLEQNQPLQTVARAASITVPNRALTGGTVSAVRFGGAVGTRRWNLALGGGKRRLPEKKLRFGESRIGGCDMLSPIQVAKMEIRVSIF
jgi:hypothetical protein